MEVYEEFGPEQTKAELLEKAELGLRTVSEALRAGVIKVSLDGQYEISEIFIGDENELRFKTKGTPNGYPGIAIWL